MEIEFDDMKDALNRDKHGVSLALGSIILQQAVGSVLDVRREYGESRANSFGLIGSRLYVCTYTIRGAAYRVISVRKASRQEQRIWLS